LNSLGKDVSGWLSGAGKAAGGGPGGLAEWLQQQAGGVAEGAGGAAGWAKEQAGKVNAQPLVSSLCPIGGPPSRVFAAGFWRPL
jgi:hypothetical protein